MNVQNCAITDLFDKPGLVQIDGVCTECGERWKLCVTKKGLQRYLNGEPIEKVFLALSVSDKHLLEKGAHSDCFQGNVDTH
jgi:hypothetical protein